MRNLMYFVTMFFNISGVLFSTGMIFILGADSWLYLPLIIFSIAIFTFSFGVTFLDFNNKNFRAKNKYVVQKPQITDYRKFFAQKRSEFII